MIGGGGGGGGGCIRLGVGTHRHLPVTQLLTTKLCLRPQERTTNKTEL